MTKIERDKKLARLPVGVVLATLLVAFLLAPLPARAACSHLVHSNTDRAQSAEARVDLSGLVLTGDASDETSGNLPHGSAPKPCSGAWCTGQPAVPLVPPGVFEGRIHTWAIMTAVHDQRSGGSEMLVECTTLLPPLKFAGSIFHPPRSLCHPA